ncbi:MAG: carbohydrate-binding protein [gamma proteobacterium symbiont of Taylorina sp.]|nr:carbohydrate-binding protein [gamma proteobacterium symbiont of Taylorina sp.]
MRKKIITPILHETAISGQEWLNIDTLAKVEMTSEDSSFPIESALLPGRDLGWRAATPGEQTIRLHFEEPLSIKRIWLNFVESDIERTQEYVLRWSADGGKSWHEIVRQQWNFSPSGATRETQDLQVGLEQMNLLELIIIPDISGGNALASLAQLHLA